MVPYVAWFILSVSVLPIFLGGCAHQLEAKLQTRDAWTKFHIRTLKDLKKFNPSRDLRTKMSGTGFYYATQIQNRWWMIDPNGNRVILIGLNSTTPYNGKTVATNLKQKYGTPKVWANQLTKRLTDLGFNTLGA